MSEDGQDMTLVKVCELSDLQEGEIFQAEVPGVEKLAIYLINGEVYASSDMCTHGEASLANEGFMEEYKVICSWHDGSFDVRTGEVLSLPCANALKTYRTEVRDGEVFAEV